MELNKLVLCIGPAGYGKSTKIRELVAEHMALPNALTLAHDPHGEVGAGFCDRYADAGAVRAELAAALSPARKPMRRGFSCGGSSSELTALAVEVGERHNTKSNVRLPMLRVDDESSLADGSTANHLTETDIALISNRRHYGIALVLNAQAPGSLHAGWYDQATEVHVFNLMNIERVRTMESRLGLRKGRLDPLMTLPKFHYLTWRRGEGVVAS